MLAFGPIILRDLRVESYLCTTHYDLVTPDGRLTDLEHTSATEAVGTLFIKGISPAFKGFEIDASHVMFNIKSTLAQTGLDGHATEISLDRKNACAELKLVLRAHGKLGRAVLAQLSMGATIGKLFAADERRRVRDPDYLSRMFGRSDRFGDPLLMLGGMQGSTDLILEKIDGRTVAYLTLKDGIVGYSDSIYGFIPTLSRALQEAYSLRSLLALHQEWLPEVPRIAREDEMLLVKTLPLHVRTVFGKVVDDLLPEGYTHTSASVLQPDTQASGDIYEFFGDAPREITDIPIEFYTLEPHREHVFFEDRDQLQSALEDPKTLFDAFETAPEPKQHRAAVFVVKGEQLLHLEEKDWILRDPMPHDLPGFTQPVRQQLMIERYIQQQPAYPFLKHIEDGLITSQGVLLSRYFPSPLMKRMFLSYQVRRFLKRVYFQYPSLSNDNFFSAEDQWLLHDLLSFAIGVYWVDDETGKILQYIQKTDSDTGLFVPPDKVQTFLRSTTLGVYGSNLEEGDFERELRTLLEGLLALRAEVNHPMLHKDTPLSLVTGGGPGAMAVGNRVASELGILSCANVVDFRRKDDQTAVINEQTQNPHIEAKMTYRLDKLVERQSAFNLDLPIILVGGIGTDFEMTLEEVCRKVGAGRPTPVILFGPPEYWKDKITYRFQSNLRHGTIKGSEWLSNCFFCVQTGAQGLQVYRQFFDGSLEIGPDGPTYEEGFVTVKTPEPAS